MSCGPSMDPIIVHVGDLEPIVEVIAKRCGTAVDWTGWSGWTFTAIGPTTITGDATADPTGTLTFVWGPGTTNVPGEYHGRFRGVSPAGKPRTFPARGYIPIVIVDDE